MIEYNKPEISLTKSELKEIDSIVKGGRFCRGQHVERLESYFKKEYNVGFAKACCNATNGLTIAITSTGIYKNHIALPVFTWPSTLYAIECSGNIPVWYDIDPNTWNMSTDTPTILDTSNLSDYCKSYMRILKTSGEIIIGGIVPVDVFGNVSYIDAPNSVAIIYDAAHGFGNPFLGNRGLAEVVSFSFTKSITAGGQGGMILTNNERLYNRISELVDLSAKVGEINALIAMSCIDKYEDKQKKRLAIIDMYREYIDIPVTEQSVGYATNHSVYSILFESNEKRNRIVDSFKSNGIEVKCYYEPLIAGFKNADDVYSRILSLPVYPSIEKHVKFISNLINKA